MAEADILAFLIAGVVGLYFTVILSILRKIRTRSKIKKSTNFCITHYSPKEKKQFLKIMPLGAVLGILVYFQHFNAIIGGESSWVLPFVQIYPVIIYATLVILFAVFKFIAAFTNVNFFADRQGYADGLMSSFVIVQVIVFVRYPLIFFPTLNP